MGPLQRQVHPPKIFRLIRPAFGVFLMLACVAAAPESAMAREGSRDAGHSCRCGAECSGAACCCGRRASRPPARGDDRDGRPCLGARPCGLPGLPIAPGVARSPGNDAAAIARIPFPPARRGRPIDVTSDCVLPTRRADRLDDPPELAGLA